MKITEVHAGWKETCSLPEYSNVSPSISFTAVVEDGETPDLVRMELIESARNQVREEINQALEWHGMPAKYHNGPTFQIMKSREKKLVVVLPDSIDFPKTFTHVTLESRKQRYVAAVRIGREYARVQEYGFLDISDGEVEKIPVQKELPLEIPERDGLVSWNDDDFEEEHSFEEDGESPF